MGRNDKSTLTASWSAIPYRGLNAGVRVRRGGHARLPYGAPLHGNDSQRDCGHVGELINEDLSGRFARGVFCEF